MLRFLIDISLDWTITDQKNDRNPASRFLLQLRKKLRSESIVVSSSATAMVNKHAYECVGYYTRAFRNGSFIILKAS